MLIPIYDNSQTKEDLLGIGRLKSKRKDGLPFIVDSEADNSQKVWIEEYWEIDWVLTTKLGLADPRKVFPIRTLYNIGITGNTLKETKKELIQDKFLKVDGIEIF